MCIQGGIIERDKLRIWVLVPCNGEVIVNVLFSEVTVGIWGGGGEGDRDYCVHGLSQVPLLITSSEVW